MGLYAPRGTIFCNPMSLESIACFEHKFVFCLIKEIILLLRFEALNTLHFFLILNAL